MFGFKQWMEDWKKKKEWEAEHARYQLAEELSLKEALLKSKQDAMFAKPCSINKGDNCYRECVHFSAGRVWQWFWDQDTGYDVVSPRCKLWGD